VYDVTKFLKLHPGGKKILLGVAGAECTEQFNQFHNATAVLAKYSPKLKIGEISGGGAAGSAAPKATAAKSTAIVLSPSKSPKTSIPKLPNATFGDQIPYGDPAWYAGEPHIDNMMAELLEAVLSRF
jgi:hypothetical protein